MTTPPREIPWTYLVTYPTVYLDQIRVFTGPFAATEALEQAVFISRIYGRAEVHRNNGRSEHVVSLRAGRIVGECSAEMGVAA